MRPGAVALALGALLAPCAGHAGVPPAASDDALIGLWAGALNPAPVLQGELTLRRDGRHWHARLADATADFDAADAILRFAFSGDRGAFRGALAADGRSMAAFWLQPAQKLEDTEDPGGAGQPFASPLRLESAGDGLWRGTVQPLIEGFTLYLAIYRDADGRLVAAFRNPEANANGGASLYVVERDGAQLRFSASTSDTRSPIVHAATVDDGLQHLRIDWPAVGRAIELERRSPAQVPEYYGRAPDAGPYVYRTPPVTGDGWETARANAVGLDEELLTALVQALGAADPAARRPALLHALLVARHGKLVLEEYFHGYARERPHDLRSAGKTFASVMLGAAMRASVAIAPETPVYTLLAARGPFAHADPQKQQITLAHLLTHTAGLACDDNDDDSPGNEGTMQGQRAQPDWWQYTLDLPMAHAPGTRYAYCSANINLVGAALTSATQTWLPAWFDRMVAGPLQFGRYYWNLMPTGEGYMGGGAFVRPRDLLKLGQTYLDRGVWRGRRILSAEWVRESTIPRVTISPATTGLDPGVFTNYYWPGQDAYAWHVHELDAGAQHYPEYEATGNGGQILIVVPALDLTVVFTAGNYMQGGIWGHWRDEIVGARIVPAIFK